MKSMDDFEEEPLYVDMFDANIPSSEWIAREEERHRMAMAGSQRLSNEEFGHLRIQARYVQQSWTLARVAMLMYYLRHHQGTRRDGSERESSTCQYCSTKVCYSESLAKVISGARVAKVICDT